MKAFTKKQYGGPEVLNLEEVEQPTVKAGHVLVKVMANSANPADWHILRGKPLIARAAFGLFKPKDKVLGADFAGIVEAVGDDVQDFKPGDRVFGESLSGGAFAEYLLAPCKVMAHMPAEATFTQMACVPLAGLTALQAVVTHGKVQAGESVLINGASGGVGHFAVQIAKAHGAIVTAVCSARNTEFAQSLGADHVIAYDREDIHQHDGKYDVVMDMHGNLGHGDFKRMGKRGVLIGFTTMGNMVSVMLRRAVSKFPLTQFTATANAQDLQTLAAMVKTKQVAPHIEQSFPYEQIPEAIRFIEAMRTRGKVAMVWEGAAS